MNTSNYPHGDAVADAPSRPDYRTGFGVVAALTVALAAVALATGAQLGGQSLRPSDGRSVHGVSMIEKRSPGGRNQSISDATLTAEENPSSSLAPDPNMFAYCPSGGIDTSPSCEQASLEAIDRGRSSEGLPPMELPSDWEQLSPTEQLFVATNLERTARGLRPFEGMATALDSAATSAAASDADPTPPAGFFASYWTSNWAGGISSPLEAIYLWMYDDGPKSPNVNCPHAGASGCWGHRDNILAHFTCAPCVVGAGVSANAYDGEASWAELMSDTTGSPALDFAWSSVSSSVGGSRVVGMAADVSAGYWLVSADGSVHTFGGAPSYGSPRLPAGLSAVGIAATPNGGGYWIVTSRGNVYAYGDAGYYGGASYLHLVAPVVGIARTANGLGYWLVASDGGVFSFGDAAFHGSTGDLRLNKPVVGMSAAPGGAGYWLVAADGGIFSFGDAAFHGSTGHMRLNRPVVGMTPTAGGRGYWLVASDGGIFSFGDAAFHGSTGDMRLAAPVVGMASPVPSGYWLVASDGGIFSFGLPFHGSLA